MQINNSFVELSFDNRSAVVHVLDLDQGGKTVTNAIEELLIPIHKRLSLLQEPLIYTWYLYGTDGYVAEYRHSFKYIPDNDPLLNKEFLEIIKQRRGALA